MGLPYTLRVNEAPAGAPFVRVDVLIDGVFESNFAVTGPLVFPITFFLSNLVEGQTVQYRFVNEFGAGPWSEPPLVVQPLLAPPNIPRSLYTRNMRQLATYFAPLSQDGFGRVDYAPGVDIVCRWQDKNDLIRDSSGREIVSSTTVYVGAEVVVGGRLALGGAASIDNAREIRNIGRTPALDTTKELLKAWL